MSVAVATVALVGASFAAGTVTYTQGTGIQGIDKLGAHQNGGRGCVGCHAPHSGSRGNGGSLTLASTFNATTKQWSNVAAPAAGEDRGDDTLWGQDIGPVLALGQLSTGAGKFVADLTTTDTQAKIKTGIIYCLSCHDGNVAKGAMMTNQSFEQAAGLLPSTYGSNTIPTLLGADGGTAGNYENDHPIGQAANVGSLGSIGKYLDMDATKTKVVLNATQPDTNYTLFQTSYGLPTVVGARTGAGFVVETTMTSVNQAYVVCTTCHTPHTMYTSTASSTNKIAGLSSGVFPTYFFIAAPYNPGADTQLGSKASSATQFCRQCHFTGAGGSNEGSGIQGIATAF